jgi:hypothetical protein
MRVIRDTLGSAPAHGREEPTMIRDITTVPDGDAIDADLVHRRRRSSRYYPSDVFAGDRRKVVVLESGGPAFDQ